MGPSWDGRCNLLLGDSAEKVCQTFEIQNKEEQNLQANQVEFLTTFLQFLIKLYI